MRPVLPALAALSAACAHAPPAPSPEAPGAVHRMYEDASLGYSLELPNDRRFKPGGGDGVAAVGEDGTVVRVFPLFVAGPADVPKCWQRVFTGDVMPEGLVPVPKDADELAKIAPKGLDRGPRRAFVQVYPREDGCLVLAVDGPAADAAGKESVRACAERAMATFKVLPPAEQLRPLLAYEAGFQLLEAGEDVAALAKFEEALKRDPALERAHLGAGLAAFFAGKGHEKQAIEHLEKAVAQRADQENPEGNAIEDKQFREALMDLGLAYEATGDHAKAKAKLVEATSRFPDDAIVQYNLACVLALSGEADDALDQLKDALAKDPSLAEHAKGDEDLVSLRPRAEFKALTDVPPAADRRSD